MSGARSDLTLGSIISSDQARRVNASRSSIDRQRDSSTGIGQMNWNESKTRAQSLRNRYAENSPVMDLYNFKKQQIMKGDELEGDWLDDVIEDSKYGWTDFGADFFGVLGAAAGAVSGAYGHGLTGGRSKGVIQGVDHGITSGYSYNPWVGTAGYRSR